jgi:metal-responsive CopG/Arc/MetJ family transcriptional regulator
MALILRALDPSEEMVMGKEFTTVSIPTTLIEEIESAIKGTEIKTVSSYIVGAVREALSKGPGNSDPFSQEDEEKVKERLKALGYID